MGMVEVAPRKAIPPASCLNQMLHSVKSAGIVIDHYLVGVDPGAIRQKTR